VFSETSVDSWTQISYAQAIGLRGKDYKLVEIK